MTTLTACPVCGTPRPADRSGNQPWCCSLACYHTFHGRPRRPITVHECDHCGARALGQQRCDDCSTFMRRVGIGGSCPTCDEPIAITKLLHEEATNPT